MEYGVNIYFKVDCDKILLYCVLKCGYLNIVEILVEKGVDVNCKNNKK